MLDDEGDGKGLGEEEWVPVIFGAGLKHDSLGLDVCFGHGVEEIGQQKC